MSVSSMTTSLLPQTYRAIIDQLDRKNGLGEALRAIRLNLNQLSHLLRTLRLNAVKGKLKPSKTAYMSWGKGSKQPLRFSKSGHPYVEETYATHFVKRPKVSEAEQTANEGDKIDPASESD
jgi:hypothetical protein